MAAAPLEVWPQQVLPVDQNTLHARTEAVETAAKGLPPSLAPAVRFQKIFLRILSGEASSAWRGDIENFARALHDSPLDSTLSEVSRAWLARVEMAGLDTVLLNYYRHNVQFPSTFAEVAADIPENLLKDPWGDPWFYEPRAPRGFDRLTGQRYQLGPRRFPQLGGLAAATASRIPAGQSWQITLRNLAGNKALEFLSKRDNASVAVLQPGGVVDDCTLVFIGDHWALMASMDRLFAIPF